MAVGGKAGRIDDGAADGFAGGVGGGGEVGVGCAGAVAALAVDAFGEGVEVYGFGEGLLAGGRDGRVSVVTEHAVVGDGAAEAIVERAIVAGIHGEVAAILGVPAEGELDEGAGGGAVKVGAGVVAGAHDEVDLLFEQVDAAALGVELIAELEVVAAALEHFEVAFRGRVEVGVVADEVFDHLLRGGAVEGAAHAGLAVGIDDVAVAGGAGFGLCGAGGGKREEQASPEGGCEAQIGAAIRHWWSLCYQECKCSLDTRGNLW